MCILIHARSLCLSFSLSLFLLLSLSLSVSHTHFLACRGGSTHATTRILGRARTASSRSRSPPDHKSHAATLMI